MTKIPDNITSQSELHAAALAHIACGIPIFPLHPNTKRPIFADGYRAAAISVAMVHQWWTQFPDANIGMPTGGYLVLDVDTKNGNDGYHRLRDLEAIHSPLPATRRQLTPSGGMHLIFTANGKYVPSRINCPAVGLDTRGNGGYIVLAPSVIDGVEYKMSDDPIADMPEWLHAVIINHPINLANYAGSLPEGAKHRFIFDVALECRRNGMTSEEAFAKVHTVNRNSTPVLSELNLERHVTAAFHDHQNQVRWESSGFYK